MFFQEFPSHENILLFRSLNGIISPTFLLYAMDKDSDFNFKINKSYAEKYNQWRRKEEIQKCKCVIYVDKTLC